MIQELGAAIGWAPDTFAGTVTHGGSLANLTALLTARNVALGDVWERRRWPSETEPRSPVAALAHADAHYSVARAAGILGLGSRQIVRGRTGRARAHGSATVGRRVGPPAGQESADRRRWSRAPAPRRSGPSTRWTTSPTSAAGTTSGCTSTRPTAARPCLSDRHRHLVAGLDRADSVVWDAHKMLFVPGLCAFVFYREKRRRFEAFRQDAPYLFDPAAPGLAEYDSGMQNGRMHQAGGGLRAVGRLVAVRPAVVRRHGRRDVRPGPHLLREAAGRGRLRAAARAAVQHRRLSPHARRAARRPERTRRRIPVRTAPPHHRVGRVLHRASKRRRRRRPARDDHQPAHHARPSRPIAGRPPTPGARAAQG